MLEATTYGQKGGEGPTRGRKRWSYRFTLPDGTPATKGAFWAPVDPVAWCYQTNGKWFVACIAERDDARFQPRPGANAYTAVEVEAAR